VPERKENIKSRGSATAAWEICRSDPVHRVTAADNVSPPGKSVIAVTTSIAIAGIAAATGAAAAPGNPANDVFERPAPHCADRWRAWAG
jgi:hypothetical protein